MDKKPLNGENEFYNGYEETTQTYLNENEKVEFVPKHDLDELKKKSFILILLMTVPMAICLAIIFWSADFFIRLPVVSGILSRFYHLLGIVAGFALSTFVTGRANLADEEKDIVNKHVIHFMGFAAVCWITVKCMGVYASRNAYVMADTYKELWALIPLATAVGLIIWGYFAYTKLERKVFIPVMCVTLLFTGGMIFRDVFRPRFDVESYSVDYYFVSYKEIEPKQQEAKYYVSKELDNDRINNDVYASFSLMKDYEDIKRDIIDYDDTYIEHDFTYDEYTAEILNKIIEDNPIYNEEFFKENYLAIDMVLYYDVPESVEISHIFVDDSIMKLQANYQYENEKVSEYGSEYCLAFIKIPKTYHMDNVNGLSEKSEYLYKN